jgi:hypothetical protein
LAWTASCHDSWTFLGRIPFQVSKSSWSTRWASFFGSSGLPKRTSFAPTTPKTSTDWCAAIARPLSLTSVGAVISAFWQASWIVATTS